MMANNFLKAPYAIAKSKNIETDGLTPSEVWKLLSDKGIVPDGFDITENNQTYKKILKYSKERALDKIYKEKSKLVDEYMGNNNIRIASWYVGNDRYSDYEYKVSGLDISDTHRDEIIRLKRNASVYDYYDNNYFSDDYKYR